MWSALRRGRSRAHEVAIDESEESVLCRVAAHRDPRRRAWGEAGCVERAMAGAKAIAPWAGRDGHGSSSSAWLPAWRHTVCRLTSVETLRRLRTVLQKRVADNVEPALPPESQGIAATEGSGAPTTSDPKPRPAAAGTSGIGKREVNVEFQLRSLARAEGAERAA